MALKFAFEFMRHLVRQDLTLNPIEAITFSHPVFSKTYRLTNQPDQTKILYENGSTYNHELAPFTVGIPARNGQLDAQLGVNVGLDGNNDWTFIRDLSDAMAQGIDNIYFAYRLGFPGQRTSFLLQLKIADVTVSSSVLSATANRADVLNTAFPRFTFNPQHYPGLAR